ncbi:cryptochrome/photolyase family protein [Rhodoferax sp. PAMC 29310]|uniref:cryptochrome/photolyase family protein n=1 Tax=Rhodoferax sp. PAMC 29310 TaxID=2822760 RepID=UPI001F0AE3F5|nr:cryptochrome/photolyase family protein [Rhodoferax sp. PAMC 29310]
MMPKPEALQNTPPLPARVRNLVIVLGDQLDLQSSALQDVDPAQDLVWMAEVTEESTHLWSSKQRIAVFLSAMRHFANDLRAQGLPLIYTALDGPHRPTSLGVELARTITQLQPTMQLMPHRLPISPECKTKRWVMEGRSWCGSF